MKTFIDELKINKILEDGRRGDREDAARIIERSKDLKGLAPEEAAVLLQCEDKAVINDLFKAAREIKDAIYGNRLVLFAPLYLTNTCVNNCLYCGFRKDNADLKRCRSTIGEIEEEVKILEHEGHKRLLLVAGEDPGTADIEYLEEAIRAVYRTRNGRGNIRRVNVNIAPLSVEEFKRLKGSGIGTYQCFQETYHRATYERVHPSGPKSDYEWRLQTMDRALEAGLNDVGIGALFGLYDYKFEVLSLLYHSLHLEEKFGVGPHTISVPRVRPALNAPLAGKVPHPVSDDEFKKLVAVIRLAVPYTGMILSTREAPGFRDEAFSLGISQISAGSKTGPGSYLEDDEPNDSEQFSIRDGRTQLQVIKDIIREGFFPSFCTACYRVGRVGKDFMDLAKPGEIKDFCLPNCILTFKEYVLDYGDDQLKKDADRIINGELDKLGEGPIKEKTLDLMRRLDGGERDLYL